MEPVVLPCGGGTSVGASTQLFQLLLQTILQAQCNISPPELWPKDFGPEAIENGLEEYDFIVVGAGAGGSVVASRLSENPKWKVLLLEAGGDPPIEAEIPALRVTYQNKTAYDWSYYAEKNDKSALGTINKGIFWPRGKMLGGSASLNGMIYIRGNDRDYNRWEELGNPGWGWENVLEYFKKSEGYEAESGAVNERIHGTKGPLKVSIFNYDQSSKFSVQESAFELGFKHLADANGEEFIGYTSAHGTVYKGTRWSPAKAFLSSTKDRKNLNIIKNAHVTKVNINGKGSAESVAFILNGKKYVVKATKEIIVSGGTVNTPQILMLSGIGPKDQLTKHNIPVIKDLKVGGNLQDHIISPFYIAFNKGAIVKPEPDADAKAMYEYAIHRDGPLSSLQGFDNIGFINTKSKTAKYPDIEMQHIYLENNNPNVLTQQKLWGYDEPTLDYFRKINKEEDIYGFLPTLMNPKSTGRIELRSADPFDPPLIYPNYLDSQEDVDTLTRALKFVQTFLPTKMMKTRNARPMKLPLPACDKHGFNTDAYWECYARHMSTTLYHPTGTAKMGPDSDPEAVVDARLRVKGIKALRVADASIMPNVVSGNTMAATIMIGEKAADLIKEDWNYDTKRRVEL